MKDFDLKIPSLTKSEEKERCSEELKEMFPDDDITGLVSRKRKFSNSHLDHCDNIWPDLVSNRSRAGSSADHELYDIDDLLDSLPEGSRQRAMTNRSVGIISANDRRRYFSL